MITSSSIAGRDVFGSLVLGVTLAIAQPVLDLLSRNLAFFAAHRAEPFDVIGLSVLLAIVLPLVVAFPVTMLVRSAPRFGLTAYALTLGVLATAVGVQFVERMVDSTAAVLTGALLVGGVLVAACLRVQALQTLLRWGTFMPAVVLGLFLVASPGSRLIATPDIVAFEAAGVGNPVPVVVLMLDELPVQSLMDAEGSIDTTRYPGFAGLLDDFTWFRNTTTMYQKTSEVLPAVLSGGPYQPDTEPSPRGYPNNLFSLLGGSYNVWAHEETASFCTPEVCRDQPQPGLLERWPLLLSDTSIVAAHVLLPKAASTALPPLEGTWTGFGSRVEEQGPNALDPRQEGEQNFADLLEALDSAGPHSLHFFHLMAPHHPWRSLPGGFRYPGDIGVPTEVWGWGEDQHVVDRAHQRHLLQTGYVDGDIEKFVNVVRGTTWYDDALILVMADHGIAFTAGQWYRAGNEDNIEEIAYVPLFVKTPGQVEGRIDDRPASLHDVLPTIVDVLDIASPWRMTGVSLLDAAPDTDRRRVFEGQDTVVLPPDHPPTDKALARKVALFGSGQGWEPVYRFGPYRDLIGRPVGELSSAAEPADVSITDAALYDEVDPGTRVVPALVRASVRSSGVSAHSWLAVALNGQVVATGRVHDWTPEEAHFSAIVPPTSFVRGANDVTLHRIETTGSGFVLHLLTQD